MADALPPGRVLPVVLVPDPVLRAPTEPAGGLDAQALARLAADMLATMYHAQGRGLAAPQIGVSRRIFVYDADWKSGDRRPVVMVDPVITARSAETDSLTEGCLSIPDHPVEVTRPVSVTVDCTGLDGRRRSVALTGIEARIVQHEYDHLQGRLITDFEPPTTGRPA